MNVLFVSNLYPPNAVGGYERLCFDVAESMVARGHAVTVLTSCYGSLVSSHSGQLIHQALQLLVGDTIYEGFKGSEHQRNAIQRANLTALTHVLEEAKPDTIFCWNLYGLNRSFLDGLIDSGIPVTTMLTDNWLASLLNPDFVGHYFRDKVFGKHVEPEPQGKPQTATLPCRAIFGARYMQAFYEEAGLTFVESRVIHNGVRGITPPNAVFKDRSDVVEEGSFKLLFAGRLVSIKGLHTAIEALGLLRSLPDAARRVSLTVIGDDREASYVGDMKRLVTRLGLDDQVTFRPPVAERDLFALFQAHDAYVFPSLYEPFSLTLILALAAGIPTLASDAGGNVEIVHDRKTGLVFEKGDAAALARSIQVMIDEPELRASVSVEGRNVAATFTFDTMVNEIATFI